MKKPGEEPLPAAPIEPTKPVEPVRHIGRSIYENSQFQMVAPKFGSAIMHEVVELGDPELKRALDESSVPLPDPEVVRTLEERKPGTVKAVFAQIREDATLPFRPREVRAIVGVLRDLYPFDATSKKR